MDNIFDKIKETLFSLILAKKFDYEKEFSCPPEYVVIPVGFKALLEERAFLQLAFFDTVYGMKIIESKSCRTVEDIIVL